MTTVARIAGNNLNAKSAADDFTQNAWDKPRKVRNFKFDRWDLATFSLVDGEATYRVAFDRDNQCWAIER